ncbi:hypothetical protein [Geobacter sulfurreducens]|uniref:hypothetical protein n=1 Tax=Geobacter sulfurreducens TaxID=35554 RepID=UPI0020B6CEE0|nr:hypothetical protein [Geobacter sulfurreducens]
MTLGRMHIGLASVSVLAGLVLCSPASVRAGISGEAELGYVRYEADANGARVSDAHSFYQRYSLLYETSGELYKGRVGRYDLALGYEWGSFDTKIKNPSNPTDPQTNYNPSVSAGHLLYRGEVVLDPLELPLRLRAYSYDTNRINMHEDLSGIDGSSIFAPRLITNLYDGMHINSGATLVFGVKNGLTNGYNAIFRHIPLVMLDYRDDVNRDLKSLVPVDTRMRRLAFVSLNKRDNWFHYRTTDFRDYLNTDQSFKETQMQIGTVDHLLARRWIDLTNWVKISADGQFTKHASSMPANSFEAYELNLFAVASRKTWDARTFSSFSRLLDDEGITLERTVPFYASGVLGADVDWKASLYSNEKKIQSPSGSVVNNSNYSASVRADMFRRSPFTLGVVVRGESTESYGSKLLSFEGGVETASTARLSRDYSLSGSYTVKYFDATGGTGSGDGYLNQNVLGRVAYAASPTWRFEVEEDLSAASGTNPRNFNNSAITVNSGFSSGTSTVSGSAISFQRRNSEIDEYVRSVTTVSAAWRPFSRTSLSFSVSEDVLMQSGAPTDFLTTFRSTIDYSTPTFLARMRNSYNVRMVGGESIDYLESVGILEYRPVRQLEGLLTYTYNVGDVDVNTRSEFLDLRQRLGYSFYTLSGANRKLLELYEEFTYNRTLNTGTVANELNTTRRFTLGVRYFPLRSLFVGADARYSLIEPGSITEQLYTGVVGLNFRKLQANLEYTYGKRDGSDNRIEKRIAANVKKFF